MEEEIYIPGKLLYQIYLTGKATNKVLVSRTEVAYSVSEAIEKVKIGSIVKELGLKREDVDFYIRVVGVLYEGDMFATALAKTPVLTTAEKATCADIKATLEK